MHTREEFNHLRKQYLHVDRALPERSRIQEEDDQADEPKEGGDWEDFGELVKPLDPKTLPVYYFYVNITGQILYGEFQDFNQVKCKYEFIAGGDWHVSGGTTKGESGFSRKRADNKTIWDLGFQVNYRTTYPFGWPQLVIQLYGSTFLESGIYAYACIHVPTQPNLQEKRVRVFRPKISKKDSSNQRRKNDEWFDAKVIATAQGREVTEVKAIGTATVLFQVTVRNMSAFGYQVE